MMLHRLALGTALMVALVACTAASPEPSPEPPNEAGFRSVWVEDYRTKMEAGWLGQMVGVGYGGPTEFTHLGQIIPPERMPGYDPATQVNTSWDQDDLYVELTFLGSMEEYGLDVSQEQAGIDFANTRYPLWHGNQAARDNIRSGIAPPDSGHPEFTEHPDDIDFQIEADVFGLVSPGLPQQAIELGDRFGHIVGYGDGVYGGQFMACLYSESFFTEDAERLIEAGLSCIPDGSQYASAVRDVVRWWQEDPKDWERTWQRIDETYHLDPSHRLASCETEGRPGFNIDAKLSGAYVVMGLLYGAGDPLDTITISTRAGQDSDCNAASAGGVIFAAGGPSAELEELRRSVDREGSWAGTDHTLTDVLRVSEELARAAVLKAGGRIERDDAGDEYLLIPIQQPRPLQLEQSWDPEQAAASTWTDEQQARIRSGRRG